MGYLLHVTGIAIYQTNISQGRSLDTSTPIIFAGSFIACLFWVSLQKFTYSWQKKKMIKWAICSLPTQVGVLATWPWYKTTDDQ